MSTKIRQLAERAFNHCCETYKDADGPVPWVWEEKFAELIIQECIKICEYAGDDIANGNIFFKEKELLKDLQAGHWETAAWYAAKELKEHFGVKE